jgi:hypothetical protein
MKFDIEQQGGSMFSGIRLGVLLMAGALAFAHGADEKEAPPVSITGYVRDSGCVHRFHEVVKPLPNGCVEACVRGGSPLVILTADEKVYHPISGEIPDVDVRPRLLPFVGKFVRVTGHVYERGGSNAISLEKVEETHEPAQPTGAKVQ